LAEQERHESLRELLRDLIEQHGARRPLRISNGQNKHSNNNGGVVLDTGALIAWERGDKRMIALLHRA
jgi:hypothetical protein